jgi:hypothetical protein
MRTVQRIGHLRGLAQIEIGIKQRLLRRRAAAYRQQAQQNQHAKPNHAQRHEPRRSKGPETVQNRLHAKGRVRASTMARHWGRASCEGVKSTSPGVARDAASVRNG